MTSQSGGEGGVELKLETKVENLATPWDISGELHATRVLGSPMLLFLFSSSLLGCLFCCRCIYMRGISVTNSVYSTQLYVFVPGDSFLVLGHVPAEKSVS